MTNAQSWKGVYCAIEMMTLYTRGVVCKQTLMLIGMYPLGLETGAQTSIRLYSMYEATKFLEPLYTIDIMALGLCKHLRSESLEEYSIVYIVLQLCR